MLWKAKVVIGDKTKQKALFSFLPFNVCFLQNSTFIVWEEASQVGVGEISIIHGVTFGFYSLKISFYEAIKK